MIEHFPVVAGILSLCIAIRAFVIENKFLYRKTSLQTNDIIDSEKLELLKIKYDTFDADIKNIRTIVERANKVTESTLKHTNTFQPIYLYHPRFELLNFMYRDVLIDSKTVMKITMDDLTKTQNEFGFISNDIQLSKYNDIFLSLLRSGHKDIYNTVIHNYYYIPKYSYSSVIRYFTEFIFFSKTTYTPIALSLHILRDIEKKIIDINEDDVEIA